jgi:CheY-like chemotaxis protein
MNNPPRAPGKSLGPRLAPQRARRWALVVDDEPDFAELIALWFRSEGWRAEIAEDGVRALALLAERHVDLIIVDLQMPRMNGWELLRRLRGRWVSDLTLGQWRPRVVVVSGRTEHEVDDFTRHLGADAFLSKPIDRRTLFNTVNELFKSTPAPHDTPITNRARS